MPDSACDPVETEETPISPIEKPLPGIIQMGSYVVDMRAKTLASGINTKRGNGITLHTDIGDWADSAIRTVKVNETQTTLDKPMSRGDDKYFGNI